MEVRAPMQSSFPDRQKEALAGLSGLSTGRASFHGVNLRPDTTTHYSTAFPSQPPSSSRFGKSPAGQADISAAGLESSLKTCRADDVSSPVSLYLAQSPPRYTPFYDLSNTPESIASSQSVPDASSYLRQVDLYSCNMLDRVRQPSLYTNNNIPPVRSPIGRSSTSGTFREIYPISPPHLSRHSTGSLTRSPLSSASSSSSEYTAQDGPISPATTLPFPPSLNTFQQMGHGTGPPIYSNGGPPLLPTTMSCRITSADGNYIKAEIEACIEKGWFKPEDNWTCYRRNYFVVKCSYDLKPAHFAQPLSLTRSNSPGLAEEILEFAMCISAEADNGAKTVELVQHTPKRDKGPQEKPKRQTLQPCPASHFHHPTMAFSTSRFPTGQDYDQTYQSNCIASFERIQFKSATQNNGRRRAAQQFYNLMVDLYAKTRSLSGEASWVKVASRVSVPVVVRGRSPGHYAEERRGNSTSSGPSPSDDSSAESHDGCIPPIGSYTVPDHQHQQHNGYRAPSGSPITDVYSSGRPTVQSFAPPEQRAGQGYAPPEMARPAQPHYGGPLGPIMTNDEDLPMQSTHAGYQFYQSSMFGPTRSG